MNKILKIALEIILAIASVAVIWFIYDSLTAPINFGELKKEREQVAIKRLNSLKVLEESFKEKYHHYTADPDSVKMFYNDDFLYVETRIGTMDDSLTNAVTSKERELIEKDLNRSRVKDAIRKKIQAENPKLKGRDLEYLVTEEFEDRINIALEKKYEKDTTLALAFVTKKKTTVKDALNEKLFAEDPNFNIDSVMVIPFSGGMPVKMRAAIVEVSNVYAPVFEAKVPYKTLLKGLDEQQIANLLDERVKLEKYPGLKMGGIEEPNNNEGNWK